MVLLQRAVQTTVSPAPRSYPLAEVAWEPTPTAAKSQGCVVPFHAPLFICRLAGIIWCGVCVVCLQVGEVWYRITMDVETGTRVVSPFVQAPPSSVLHCSLLLFVA